MKYLLLLPLLLTTATGAIAGRQVFSETDTYTTHSLACGGSEDFNVPGFDTSKGTLTKVYGSLDLTCQITISLKLGSQTMDDGNLGSFGGAGGVFFGDKFAYLADDGDVFTVTSKYNPKTDILKLTGRDTYSTSRFTQPLTLDLGDSALYTNGPVAFSGGLATDPFTDLDLTNATITNKITVRGSAEYFYAAVPEPASWAMMIGGIGFVGGAMRRRSVRVAYS